jgi:hypothetical protein
MYKYKISSTGGNSTKYGNCEICGEPATEVFYQSEERKFFNPITQTESYTQDKCICCFGHKKCLESKQR